MAAHTLLQENRTEHYLTEEAMSTQNKPTGPNGPTSTPNNPTKGNTPEQRPSEVPQPATPRKGAEETQMGKEGSPVTSTDKNLRDLDRNTRGNDEPTVESDLAVEDDSSSQGVTNDQQEQNKQTRDVRDPKGTAVRP